MIFLYFYYESIGQLAMDDSVDPLDAFMASIQSDLAEVNAPPSAPKPEIMDESEQQLRDWEGQRAQLREAEGRDEQRGSDNGLDASLLVGLDPVDHASVVYAPFAKSAYCCHSDILRLRRDAAAAKAEVAKRRAALQVRVRCSVALGSAEVPLLSFAHCGFGAKLRVAIQKQNFERPTPIQAQAIPIIAAGFDVIGIAKTGSGKTLAFGWPLLLHVMAQRRVARGEGPIALVLEPTRELAEQTHREIRRFAKTLDLRVVAVVGGGAKWEQTKLLKRGAEVVVATPGRLIDMIKAKALNLRRTTLLVLDEADRMLSMGFEPQVRCIVARARQVSARVLQSYRYISSESVSPFDSLLPLTWCGSFSPGPPNAFFLRHDATRSHRGARQRGVPLEPCACRRRDARRRGVGARRAGELLLCTHR